MNSKVDISIIIPFLNEQESIPELVLALNSFISTKSFSTEVIFVNDGSTDQSIEILKKQKFENYQAKVISFSKNFGSHAALRAGIANANGDYITFMYADLQDPISLIERLFSECNKGYDIVWAHRKSSENKISEKIFSSIYSKLMKKFVDSAYPEKGFDIVMFSQKIQAVLNQNVEANSSLFLQILTLGFGQSSIEYEKKERKAGKSKWTLAKKIKLFIDSFIAFSYAPIRFVTIIGILLFVFGTLSSSYLILRKLIYNDLESGWPALISILMIGFGITNISLGILAEYLWRTLDVSRRRPVFIINEIFKLD